MEEEPEAMVSEISRQSRLLQTKCVTKDTTGSQGQQLLSLAHLLAPIVLYELIYVIASGPCGLFCVFGPAVPVDVLPATAEGSGGGAVGGGVSGGGVTGFG